jgi:hypothetical protein
MSSYFPCFFQATTVSSDLFYSPSYPRKIFSATDPHSSRRKIEVANDVWLLRDNNKTRSSAIVGASSRVGPSQQWQQGRRVINKRSTHTSINRACAEKNPGESQT